MEETTLQSNTKTSGMDDYFLQKKVEVMIDMNNKKITNEMKKLNEMVVKLNEEISEIKKCLNGAGQIKKTESEALSEIKGDDSKRELNTPKKDEAIPRPRYGDYQPQDVAIDKFFYFGNKK